VSLKEFVDNHPIALMTSVVVAAVCVAAGVVGSLSSQQLELERSHHRAEFAAQQQQYDEKIADFTRRLASIERRVGENPKYFDVSQVVLSRDQLQILSRGYKQIISGFLYVNVPADSSWNTDQRVNTNSSSRLCRSKLIDFRRV
jgi:hypothetical protein